LGVSCVLCGSILIYIKLYKNLCKLKKGQH
jgi:hypothetical protein